MRLSVLCVLLFFFTAPVFAESVPPSACLELLQDRCQKCHYLSRVCLEVGQKSKRRWAATLKRMVKRRGATLSKEEHKFLLDCLVPPDPAIKQECGK